MINKRQEVNQAKKGMQQKSTERELGEDMYVKNGTGRLKKVLLSKPKHVNKAEQINEIAKKWDLKQIDETLIQQEFLRLQKLYEKLGIEVTVVETTGEMPHAMFARDLGGCVREGYILGKFKHAIRKQETNFFQKSMETAGVPMIGQITGEGTFEGGDFAFLNEKTIAVGIVDRTNLSGVLQIRELLEPLGYSVHAVKTEPAYLHLDMCFNLVTPDIAIGYKEGLPVDFLELLEKLEIDLVSGAEEEIFQHGYNVQAIGDKRVVSLAQNKELNKEMRKRGIEVFELDITESLKLGGGIHCMTFPLKRE